MSFTDFSIEAILKGSETKKNKNTKKCFDTSIRPNLHDNLSLLSLSSRFPAPSHRPVSWQKALLNNLSPDILRRRYTRQQIDLLTQKYNESNYVSRHQMAMLAIQTNLSMLQVKIWFQNRRLKDRKRLQALSVATSESSSVKSNEESDNKKMARTGKEELEMHFNSYVVKPIWYPVETMDSTSSCSL